MQRQTYGTNPATGRVEHHYVDHGPAQITVLRGTRITPRGAKYGSANHGRKITGGGAPA